MRLKRVVESTYENDLQMASSAADLRSPVSPILTECNELTRAGLILKRGEKQGPPNRSTTGARSPEPHLSRAVAAAESSPASRNLCG